MTNFHSLPDLSGYESATAKKVRLLAEEWFAKFKEVGAVEAQVDEARQALEEAKVRDRETRPIAERKGTRRPRQAKRGASTRAPRSTKGPGSFRQTRPASSSTRRSTSGRLADSRSREGGYQPARRRRNGRMAYGAYPPVG